MSVISTLASVRFLTCSTGKTISATRCKQGKLILIPLFRVDTASADDTQRVVRSDYEAPDKNCKVGDKEQVSAFEGGLRECARGQ
jgi:hypothetical protein